MTPLSIPSPVRGRLAPRPAPDPRLRAVHHPRHRRRDLDRRAPLGRPRRPARARSPTSRSGRCRSASSAAGSTTWSPTTTLYFGAGGDPIEALYVWQGGLGIWGAIALGGARRLDRRPAQGHPAAADGRRAGARHRWSPRRSAAGATGSTRSCSASRPTCPGAWRSTRSTGRPATSSTPPSTRRSSTSASGTSASFGFVIWADRRFRLGHGRVFALYVMAYTARPRLDRDAPHRRRRAQRRRSGCGSTCGPRSCCSSRRAVYFVVSSRRHPGREERGLRRRTRPGATPSRPPATARAGRAPTRSSDGVSTPQSARAPGR